MLGPTNRKRWYEDMLSRRHVLLLLAGALASMGASYRTTNFTVEAPAGEVAEKVGRAAEYWRRREAVEWLGRELPAWSQPCTIRVTLSLGTSGGCTVFAFNQGRVIQQDMRIEGTLDAKSGL